MYFVRFLIKVYDTTYDRQHLSYDVCREVRREIIRTVLNMQCVCVWQINGCVVEIFPSCLLDLLTSLLAISSDESIKGFVQTLKVSGAYWRAADAQWMNNRELHMCWIGIMINHQTVGFHLMTRQWPERCSCCHMTCQPYLDVK